jgi:hypothetical protein
VLSRLREIGGTVITREYGEKFAKDLGALAYIETSAKMNSKNTRKLFEDCILSVLPTDGKCLPFEVFA